MSLHTLDEVRARLPAVLARCIAAARSSVPAGPDGPAQPSVVQALVVATGAGKSHTSIHVAADAHKNGQGICIAFPSRELRNEMAAKWSDRSRAQGSELGSPFVVRSVAEKCGVGNRFNHLIAAGYAEGRDPEDSLHGAVCPDGRACGYRRHLKRIAAAAKKKKPLLCTHAWLLSPLAQDLLSEHGYKVIVDEAHTLVEQEEIRVETLQPYRGVGRTTWDDWSAPCRPLASMLIDVLVRHAADGRAAALALRAEARRDERHWRPTPFPIADIDVGGWLLQRVDREALRRAVSEAAAVEEAAPPPLLVDPVHSAWMPRIAMHLDALLDGRLPVDVGGALTARVEIRTTDDGDLDASAYLMWTRWSDRLPDYPLVLMDATGRLSEPSLRAAYPMRELEFHELDVRWPGMENGLHLLWVPTKSLRTANLRGRNKKLSRRGRGAVRHALLVAIRKATELLGRPPAVGFIAAQYVVRTVLDIPIARGDDQGDKLVQSLLAKGRIKCFKTAYFGNLRGTNDLERCDLVILFGDPVANLANINDVASVLGVSARDLLWSTTAQEALQALGRGRPLDVCPDAPLVLVRFGRYADFDSLDEETIDRAAEPAASMQWERLAQLPAHRPRSEDRQDVDAFVAELLQVGPASPLVARAVLMALARVASDEDLAVMPVRVVALLEQQGIGEPSEFLSRTGGREVFREVAEGIGATARPVKLTPGRGRPTNVWCLDQTTSWFADHVPDDLLGGAEELAQRLLQRWRGISPRSEYQESSATHFAGKIIGDEHPGPVEDGGEADARSTGDRAPSLAPCPVAPAARRATEQE